MTNWTGIDSSTKDRFSRATEIVYNDGTVGAGGKLLQNYIDRVVQFLSMKEMGLLAVLDRRSGSGPAAFVNRRGPGGAGGTWVKDDGTGSPTSLVGAFTQAEFKYMSLVTRGTVSRKSMAIGQSYIDILAMEMAGKAEDFADQLEDGLLLGSFGVAQTVEPMGLLTLIENVNRAGATATTDGDAIKNNCVGQTSAMGAAMPISLNNLDKTIDAVKGSANRSDLVIVGSFAGIRQVNAALQANQRFVDETEIAAGFRVRTYDGIPLIVSSSVPDTLEFKVATTGKMGHVSSLTGQQGTQLYVLNKRHVFISELTPTTVLPLAQTTSMSDAFDMYWDGAPVLANTFGAAILSNISSTGAALDNV